MIQQTRTFLQQRQAAYHHVFNDKSNMAEAVLEDLAKFCRANETTFHADPRIHAALEGRRDTEDYKCSHAASVPVLETPPPRMFSEEYVDAIALEAVANAVRVKVLEAELDKLRAPVEPVPAPRTFNPFTKIEPSPLTCVCGSSGEDCEREIEGRHGACCRHCVHLADQRERSAAPVPADPQRIAETPERRIERLVAELTKAHADLDEARAELEKLKSAPVPAPPK